VPHHPGGIISLAVSRIRKQADVDDSGLTLQGKTYHLFGLEAQIGSQARRKTGFSLGCCQFTLDSLRGHNLGTICPFPEKKEESQNG
jgi:hypothetical protein